MSPQDSTTEAPLVDWLDAYRRVEPPKGGGGILVKPDDGSPAHDVVEVFPPVTVSVPMVGITWNLRVVFEPEDTLLSLELGYAFPLRPPVRLGGTQGSARDSVTMRFEAKPLFTGTAEIYLEDDWVRWKHDSAGGLLGPCSFDTKLYRLGR